MPRDHGDEARRRLPRAGAALCEVRHAPELVYADDLDTVQDEAFEPIGISCRICERQACHQRAVPPLKHKLTVDEQARDTVPYGFD